MLRYRLRGIGLSAMALFLIVIFANKYLDSIQSNYNSSLLVQKKYIEKLESQIKDIETSRNERWLAYKRFSILQSPHRYSFFFSEFLRKLSLIVPDEITIDYMESQKTDSGWKFSFDGNIVADDPLQAEEIFSNFSEKLKHIEFLENPIISSLQMKSNPMESERITMIFKVQGEIKI